MFQDLGPAIRGAGQRIRIDEVIPWSMRFLRKDDRVVWYLSILQRYALYLLREKAITKSRRQRRKIKRKLCGFTDRRIIEDFETFTREKWEHFADMQAVFMSAEMLEFPFYDPTENRSIPKRAKDILNHFEEVEKKLVTQPGGARFCNDGVPFVESDYGWYWFRIEEGYSTQEAKAMRHCGNGMGRKGDILLSLREPIHKLDTILWKPHLTFILNNGYLGEMKGFANQKPDACFHPHIENLLGEKEIKGVKGGGFLPSCNFSFLDLERATQQRILEKRPDFEFDRIPAGGETILSFGEAGEWEVLDHSSMPDAAIGSVYSYYNEIPKWYLFRKFIPVGNARHHISIAWCFLEKGKISYLHQEGQGLSSTTCLSLLQRPEIKSLHEDILNPNSSWAKLLSLDEIKFLMEKKPSLLSSVSIECILEKIGVCPAFIKVVNTRFGMKIKLLGDRLILESYSSLADFAECTGIGSMSRKIAALENHLIPKAKIDLFGMEWLHLRVQDDLESPLVLVLEKKVSRHFFDTLNLDQQEPSHGLLREIIYRFGPPDPKLHALQEAA